MKVVTPDWIVKSVAAQTLLRWQDFMLTPPAAKSSFGLKTSTGTQSTGQVASLVRHAEKNHAQSPITQNSMHATPQVQPSSTPSIIEVNLVEDSGRKPARLDATTPSSHPPPAAANPTAPTTVASRTSKDPLAPEAQQERPSYALHDSNPFAQKFMNSADWRANHTSASENYAESYFQHSRLHHLSAWKSELKALVLEARERADKEDRYGKLSQEILPLESDGTSMQGMVFNLPKRSPKKQKENTKTKEANDTSGIDLSRVIMHCDFDCFFASVGLLDRPELKGTPVVVCHGGTGGGLASTSEIASASYEAREFGIKNGMRCEQFLDFFSLGGTLTLYLL